MAYQPMWVRGSVAGTADRECADRYEVIRSFITPYRRQITSWDLGANLGYFGLRLAHDVNAVSVMVDSRPELVSACRANGLPTTMAMTHRLSVADLREIAASEAPDVVLALNVLHHFDDWRGALEAVLGMADRAIIETPGRGDVRSANYREAMRLLDAIEALGVPVTARFPSHVTPGVMRPMFVVDRVKDHVTAGYAYVERVRKRGRHPVRPHRIVRDMHTAVVSYGDGETRQWYPGVNLWNWAQMGGSWPTRQDAQSAVRSAFAAMPARHGDFRPWNLILQGQSATVIDVGHRRSTDDDAGLEQTVRWIAHPEQAYV
jgi:hypothetical protein